MLFKNYAKVNHCLCYQGIVPNKISSCLGVLYEWVPTQDVSSRLILTYEASKKVHESKQSHNQQRNKSIVLFFGQRLLGNFCFWLEKYLCFFCVQTQSQSSFVLSCVMLTNSNGLQLIFCEIISVQQEIQALVRTLEHFVKYQCLADGFRSLAPNVGG